MQKRDQKRKEKKKFLKGNIKILLQKKRDVNTQTKTLT